MTHIPTAGKLSIEIIMVAVHSLNARARGQCLYSVNCLNKLRCVILRANDYYHLRIAKSWPLAGLTVIHLSPSCLSCS